MINQNSSSEWLISSRSTIIVWGEVVKGECMNHVFKPHTTYCVKLPGHLYFSERDGGALLGFYSQRVGCSS